MARATKKRKYKCINGPYEGNQLLLTTPNTLRFSVRGETGRYVAGMQRLRTIGCAPLDHAALAIEDLRDPVYIATRDLSSPTLIWQKGEANATT